MTLHDKVELETTRQKLRVLEEHYESEKRATGGDEHVRELSMRSIRRIINELKEEIARFQAHVSPGSRE